MNRPQHYRHVSHDPSGSEQVLASFGKHPAYFLRSGDSKIRPALAREASALEAAFGQLKPSDLPTPQPPQGMGKLRKKAAGYWPYGKRLKDKGRRYIDY